MLFMAHLSCEDVVFALAGACRVGRARLPELLGDQGLLQVTLAGLWL